MADLDYVCRPRLVWPENVRRTPAADRSSSLAFRSGGKPINTSAATVRLIKVLEAFSKVDKPWRTEAVEIAADWDVGRLGGFLATSRNPSRDPGAVLSFDLDGKALTLPSDAYDSVAGNLAAIAKHLEAIRGIERWGVSTVEQLLSAHAALPRYDGGEGRAWWEVLGVAPDAGTVTVEGTYRILAKRFGPDMPEEDSKRMAEINVARDEWRASR